MPLSKPYYRIVRINDRNSGPIGYIKDSRYASDRFALIQAYQLIEKDFKNILEFIEPSDKNKGAYSHRLYELFLRCATEFETNCKRILDANGYQKRGDLILEDYHKINQATKISKYKVKMNRWYPNTKILKPMEKWSDNHHLSWYDEYNKVKHDRFKNFEMATLENTINAATSVLILLFAQFGEYAFNQYNNETMLVQEDEEKFCYYDSNALFSVKPFTDWTPEEQYYFNEKELLNEPEPFEKYPFTR